MNTDDLFRLLCNGTAQGFYESADIAIRDGKRVLNSRFEIQSKQNGIWTTIQTIDPREQ
jgi:hypothetical protein